MSPEECINMLILEIREQRKNEHTHTTKLSYCYYVSLRFMGDKHNQLMLIYGRTSILQTYSCYASYLCIAIVPPSIVLTEK